MKKTKIFAAAAALMLGLIGFSPVAFATDEEPSAKVTVAVIDQGNIEVANEEFKVTDSDGDGKLTVNDALIVACGDNYASEYYEPFMSTCISKIYSSQGADGAYPFGFYVNSAMPMTDVASTPITDGDYISAFSYADKEYFADTYMEFEQKSVEGKKGDKVELTLYYGSFDENFNSVMVPCENAQITVNGEEVGVRTDANGKATVELPKKSGTISAVAGSQKVISPVCVVTVEGSSTNAALIIAIVVAAVVLLAVVIIVVVKSTKTKKAAETTDAE